MRLSLNFSAGRIRGNGSDENGAFDVIGEYAGEIARLAKSYGSHIVRYDGRWDGASIAGPWTIHYGGFVDRGEFEMWPERESVTVEEILALADEAIERRDLVPIGGAGPRRVRE